MDIDLLKKVAQSIRVTLEIPKEIKGYSDKEVAEAVADLESKGVIRCGKVIKSTPTIGNYTAKIGDVIPVQSSETVEAVTLSEYEFKKNYGENFY